MRSAKDWYLSIQGHRDGRITADGIAAIQEDALGLKGDSEAAADLLAALQASRRTMQTIKDNTSRSDSMTLEQAQYKLCIMDGLLHERLKLLDAAIAKARTVPAH